MEYIVNDLTYIKIGYKEDNELTSKWILISDLSPENIIINNNYYDLLLNFYTGSTQSMCQITEEISMSEERILIYDNDIVLIKNISTFTEDELLIYNNYKNMCQSLIE